MPKFIPEGFIDFSLELKRDNDQDPYFVTWACAVTVPPFTEGDMADVVIAVHGALSGQMSTSTHFAALNAREGTSGEPRIFRSETGLSGSNENQSVPQNCAVLVNKLTGIGGRRNKGRIYWPFATENAVSEVGVITGSYRTQLQEAFTAFFGVVDVAGDIASVNGMYILHSGPTEATTPEPTLVTSLLVQDTIATQRRRLRR